MTCYPYEPLDLDRPSFRLLRLLKGVGEAIACDIFTAWLGPENERIEFEALSYTWGSVKDPKCLWLGGCDVTITSNLYAALHHLRLEDRDRTLWVDAVCIDQGNLQERGHQVRQMASIYGYAARVLIWLGPGTFETDFVLDCVKGFERETLKYACNSWKTTDARWKRIWSVAQKALSSMDYDDALTWQINGLKSMLSSPWFERVWILQEVANARVADVVCGSRAVSARVFALLPSLLDIIPQSQRQEVLNLMPGPSRDRTQIRTLQNLLEKFHSTNATDPRDKVYALLGISSDASDTDVLRPNYEWSEQEAVHRTVVFLFELYKVRANFSYLPNWTMGEFLIGISSLGKTLFNIVVRQGDLGVMQLLALRDDISLDSPDRSGRTPLSWVAERDNANIVKFLLKAKDVHVNTQDAIGRTPLSWAAAQGSAESVKLLLARSDININLKDKSEKTPLFWAIEGGHAAIVRQLVERKDMMLDLQNAGELTPLRRAYELEFTDLSEQHLTRTPLETREDLLVSHDMNPEALYKSSQSKYTDVIRLLVEQIKAREGVKHDIGRPDNLQTEDRNLQWIKSQIATGGLDVAHKCLTRAAKLGIPEIIEYLMRRDDVEPNLVYDHEGCPPLWIALVEGHEEVAVLLIGWKKVKFNSDGRNGPTPLLYALKKGLKEVVKAVFKRTDININHPDKYTHTVLSWLVEREDTELLTLLLERDDVVIDSEELKQQTDHLLSGTVPSIRKRKRRETDGGASS